MDELAEAFEWFRPEGGLPAPAMGPGLDRPGLAVASDQPDDEGDLDDEPPCDLTPGLLAALDGPDDADP